MTTSTRARAPANRQRDLKQTRDSSGPALPAEAFDATPERARAWLAAIVSSSDDAIVSKNLQGIITSWNPAAERMFGYSAAEMVGQSVLRIIPPELRHEEPHILARMAAGERIEHFETERLRKDGTRVHVSLSISPIVDARGRPVGASKIARDISEQRKSDRERALLAAIVRSTDDAIISKSLDGVVVTWNPAAERLYGYMAAEMVGEPILRIVPPELHDEEQRIIAKIRAGERIEHYPTVRVRKDGSRVDVSITVSPVRDAEGRIIGASKIARDITGEREAQRKKDHFVAVLAHELRNPLAPVRSAIALLGLPGVAGEQRARALAIAERQVQHMSRLLEDLLDVSRVATGRVELKKSVVELGPLVAQAVDATRSMMEAKGHRLTVTEADRAVRIDADPARIVQIVANLLTNAAKYTDPGGRIALTTRLDDGEAVVRVKDNGIGFAPEMRERLFTLFSQAPESVERAAGGLGIGLALVREFTERHGGSVEAHSKGPGEGAEFVVRFPAWQGDARAAARA